MIPILRDVRGIERGPKQLKLWIVESVVKEYLIEILFFLSLNLIKNGNSMKR